MGVCGSEVTFEPIEGRRGNISDLQDPQLPQPPFRLCANAPQSRYGQAVQELFLSTGLDHDQPIGFLQIGCHLGKEFVGRDADRDCEFLLLEDLPFDSAGDRHGVTEEALAGGDIEESLVDAEFLDELCIGFEYLHDVLGDLAIEFATHGQECGARAASVRF